MSFVEILSELDLSKNEALLYEALVDKGELGVSELARESRVNRRNVYDTLDRLAEKGLVFEIKQARESRYKAVHPRKLREILKEKEQKLESILMELEYMYKETPSKEEVYIYRGIEGWKNAFFLFLEQGEDLYTIGGKGALGDEKIRSFTASFFEQFRNNGNTHYALFDSTVEQKRVQEVFSQTEYHFLPKEIDSPSVVDICGDYVVIFSDLPAGEIDENSSFTVIKNTPVAESFRKWFQYLWDISEETKEKEPS